ncbi:MAG: CHC2 zinc finger domain-containing protein [Bryobacteraceae bacterium]|nr:CHC2 zinc finger domain-containing protein [Bryobacteraceae bacterium]
MTAELIASALRARRTGAGRWMARCPAHEDRDPSLSITESGGKVLVHCFGGCAQHDVIEALRARGLWPERKREWFPRPDYEAEQRRLKLMRAAELWKRGLIRRLEDARSEAWREFLEAESAGDDRGQQRAATDLLRLAACQRRLRALGGPELLEAYGEARRNWPRTVLELVNLERDDEDHARQIAALCVAMLAAAQELAVGGAR